MAKNKRTPKWQKEFRKQRNRIRDFINRAQKQGYFFDFTIPAPKRAPTKRDVERLKRVTPDYLRSRGVWADLAGYGEVVPAQEAFKQKRRESAQKAADTRRRRQQSSGADYGDYLDGMDFVVRIVDRLMQGLTVQDEKRFNARNPENVHLSRNQADYVRRVLQAEINEFGYATVAKRLSKHVAELDEAIDQLMYGYFDDVREGASTLVNAITDRAMTFAEAQEYADVFES